MKQGILDIYAINKNIRHFFCSDVRVFKEFLIYSILLDLNDNI